MKKVLPSVMVCLTMLSLSFSAFAAEVQYRIYSDAINCNKGASIEVPVMIDNNAGIMGFSIVVTFDSDIFTPTAAVRGSVLTTGLINDSIETAQPGSFKVVYTGNTNETSNGVLFTLNFDLADNAVGNYDIELSYTQVDTFKEGYTDVTLNCENISVSILDPNAQIEPLDTEKKLSERIINWLNSLAASLRKVFGVIIIPLSFIISIFD